MTRRLALALMITLSLAACRKEEAPPAPAAAPPPPATVEPAVAAAVDAKPGAALSVTEVQLGTAVGEDFRISAPSSSFAPGDTIIAAITLTNAATPASKGAVTASWTGADGGNFNEESQEKDFTGVTTVNFRVAEPKGFKPGNYKLDVLLNGSIVETREFSVK